MILGGRPRSIILAGLFLLILSCTATVLLIRPYQQRQRDACIAQQLLTAGRIARDVLRSQWPRLDTPPTSEILRQLRDDGAEVAVVTTDGSVVLNLSSLGPTAALLGTPAVEQALNSGWGTGHHPGTIRGRPLVCAAIRIRDNVATRGVLWLARPEWRLWHDPAARTELLAAGILIGLINAAAATFVFFRLRSSVFKRVLATARSLSTGDLSSELDVGGADELAVLSSSLNALRHRLASQLETIDRQRRMLQSLVDHLGEGVIVAGADGRIALVNPTALKLLGITPAADHHATWVGAPVEACIRPHALQGLLLGPAQSPDGEYRREPEWPAVDDDQLPVEIQLQIELPRGTVHLLAHATALELPEETPVAHARAGRVVVLTDITELERIIEMRSDFVANASHELRTPLSTIRAAVETLLTMDLATEAPAALGFLAKIDRQSARLQQMVADLLDLSRLESPAERFEPEEVDLHRLLTELHFRFVEALDRKNLNWEMRIEPPDTRAIQINPHLLRLALDNLVDNAIKFTNEGGYLTVTARHHGDSVELEVRDDGCGIPEEDQARVFERFYQVQRSRSGQARGTGLGLSIVRHATGAMQGQVKLRSALGQGTIVTIVVPQSASRA